LPAVKGANGDLRRMDQVIMGVMNLARFESHGPKRGFEPVFESSVVGGEGPVEAVFEITGQESAVLEVLGRLSLGVEDGFDALDDVFAMGEEEAQEFEVFLKRRGI